MELRQKRARHSWAASELEEELLDVGSEPPSEDEAPEPDYSDEDDSRRSRATIKWAGALEARFLKALQQAGGVWEAKPKAILQRMGAFGAQLTTIQVKSHLQKHRIKVAAEQQRQQAATASGGSAAPPTVAAVGGQAAVAAASAPPPPARPLQQHKSHAAKQQPRQQLSGGSEATAAGRAHSSTRPAAAAAAAARQPKKRRQQRSTAANTSAPSTPQQQASLDQQPPLQQQQQQSSSLQHPGSPAGVSTAAQLDAPLLLDGSASPGGSPLTATTSASGGSSRSVWEGLIPAPAPGSRLEGGPDTAEVSVPAAAATELWGTVALSGAGWGDGSDMHGLLPVGRQLLSNGPELADSLVRAGFSSGTGSGMAARRLSGLAQLHAPFAAAGDRFAAAAAAHPDHAHSHSLGHSAQHGSDVMELLEIPGLRSGILGMGHHHEEESLVAFGMGVGIGMGMGMGGPGLCSGLDTGGMQPMRSNWALDSAIF